MTRRKTYTVALALMLSTGHALGADEEGGRFRCAASTRLEESFTYFGGHHYAISIPYMKCRVMVNEIKISSITLNRGNCPAPKIDYDRTYKFGESFTFDLAKKPEMANTLLDVHDPKPNCEVIEMKIETDQGTSSMSAND
jgi:hypothetical protein